MTLAARLTLMSGIPLTGALVCFIMSRANPVPYDGSWFAGALTCLVIATVLGAAAYWAHVTSALRDRHEDDVADLRVYVRRLEQRMEETRTAPTAGGEVPTAPRRLKLVTSLDED